MSPFTVLIMAVLVLLVTATDEHAERNLQYARDKITGTQMSNGCASLFNGRQMPNGKTCNPPCNNPCNYDPRAFPQGCGIASYCACGNALNAWSLPKMVCSFCPYTKAGTQCPGDGFYYDKTYPVVSPVVKPVAKPVAPLAPECYGNTFGTCTPGAYCRQKSTDWTYVCTSPCPDGMTCPGDGKRYRKVAGPPTK